MRAATLTGFGLSEELISILKEAEVPKLGPRQIIIRVKACALSEFDVLVRKGSFSEIPIKLPLIPGNEFSGIVEQIGSQVPSSTFAVGDEVVGISPLDMGGALAEYLTISFEYLTHKPKSISFEDGAACLLAGVRAYTAFFYHTRLQPTDTVLIHSGASGLNHIAVQLASSTAVGARVLSTSASSEESNYLQDMPVTLARVIDTTADPQWHSVALSETGGMGIDCLLDYLSQTTTTNLSQSISSLSSSSSIGTSSYNAGLSLSSSAEKNSSPSYSNHQIISCLGAHSTWISSVPVQLDPPESKLLLLRNSRVSFLFEHTWLLSSQHLGRYQHILKDLMEKVAKNILRPKVTKVFPLEKIRDAYRLLEVTRVGKIVIRI